MKRQLAALGNCKRRGAQYELTKTRPGIYSRKLAGLPMAGRCGLTFTVRAKGSPLFTALLVDDVEG